MVVSGVLYGVDAMVDIISGDDYELGCAVIDTQSFIWIGRTSMEQWTCGKADHIFDHTIYISSHYHTSL
jgi:hypothetical protein